MIATEKSVFRYFSLIHFVLVILILARQKCCIQWGLLHKDQGGPVLAENRFSLRWSNSRDLNKGTIYRVSTELMKTVRDVEVPRDSRAGICYHPKLERNKRVNNVIRAGVMEERLPNRRSCSLECPEAQPEC